jgi:hypothetical protein
MIKFQYDGKQWRLKFFHERDVAENNSSQMFASRGGLTTVILDTMGEDGKWTEFGAFGQAFCHPQDNFCKETGRRVALEDLFKAHEGGISKAMKKAINTAYWTRK